MTTTNRKTKTTKQAKPLPKVGIPVQYKNCYIVRAAEGYDCVDMRTGRWIHLPDARRAKWNASVWCRLTDEFGGSTERTFTDKQVLDGMAYTPKGKK
jgi:hypothetical protein